METQKQLEKCIYGLLLRLPYYGAMLQSFAMELTDRVATAGVSFDKGGKSVRLSINPQFFDSLTEAEREALLIHEVSHVDRLHLIRIPLLAPDDWRTANIAADMSINCYIPNLPQGGFYPSTHKLPDYKTFEYYYEAIPKKSSMQNATEFDSHDWESSGLSVDSKADILQNTFERAMQKLGSNAGDLPAHVAEALKALKAIRTKNWHKELRKFVGRYVNSWDSERTWSRRNRRYGLLEAGTKTGQGKRIGVAFDTSGSMSQDELQRALAETIAMLKRGVSGDLLLFDTQVNSITRLTRRDEIEIGNRGGTCFEDLMLKASERRYDALVVFTDGDDATTVSPPKCPVLWVFTDGMRDKYKWGYRTVLDDCGKGASA